MAAADLPASDPSASADSETPAGAPASADAGPIAGPADSASAADDPVKARFRDALERKKGRHADGVGGGGPTSGKVSDVHSRAGGKRQFRRKSGG
jgi:hypothetical protein